MLTCENLHFPFSESDADILATIHLLERRLVSLLKLAVRKTEIHIKRATNWGEDD